MQTIAPVDIHVGNIWRKQTPNHVTFTTKTTSIGDRNSRATPHMRTCVTNKTKTTRTKSVLPAAQTIVQPKTVASARSRSPSPNREPW
jgi:hypothetical protein